MSNGDITPPISIPTIGDLTSVSWWIAAINTVVLEVITLLTLLHPGFIEPSWVQGVIPAVSQILATVVWVWVMVIHKAAVEAFAQMHVARSYASIPNVAPVANEA